jgi:hypothetical protein
VKEGGIMAAAAQEDLPKLKAVGLDPAEIAALTAAVGAVSYTQAKFIAAMGEMKDAARQWSEEEPQALELRADILAAAAYALRNVPDAVRAVRRIRQGSSGADMIQDLQSLAELGRKYQKELQTINFDGKLLDTASQKSDALRKVYAKASVEKATAGAKDLRDRAFAYMRLCMAEVLDAAEYALRKDPSRLDYYHSAYRSRRSGSSEPAAAETAAATPAAS